MRCQRTACLLEKQFPKQETPSAEDVFVSEGLNEKAFKKGVAYKEPRHVMECQNCLFVVPKEILIPLEECKGLEVRLTPGDTVPEGECPQCGAFVVKRRIG